MAGVEKEHKDKILEDLNILSTSITEEVFEVALPLFIKKWKLMKKPAVTKAMDHFKKEWIGNESRYSRWYRGAAPGCVMNNNGLESTCKREGK